jgi:UPF0271 protein
MKANIVDLNCDLGEGFGVWNKGDDAAIMPFISSANIACGFHAGDPSTMRKTVKLALQHQVKLGAHPGFPDLPGFGRRELACSAEEVYDMVLYQIGALWAIAKSEGGMLHHVKPHGALYNMAAKNERYAEAIVRAIKVFDENLVLYGLAHSELTEAAESNGLRYYHEYFADRRYTEEAASQVMRLLSGEQHLAEESEADEGLKYTVCVHGDGPKALSFLQKLTYTFQNQQIIWK